MEVNWTFSSLGYYFMEPSKSPRVCRELPILHFFFSYPTLSGACLYFLTLSCVTALLHPMAATYNPPCPCPSKRGRSGVEQGPRMLEPSSPGTARPVVLARVAVLPCLLPPQHRVWLLSLDVDAAGLISKTFPSSVWGHGSAAPTPMP